MSVAGFSRMLARYAWWPIAGVVSASAFESIRTIGAPTDGFDPFVPVAGFAAGLFVGVPAGFASALVGHGTRWVIGVWGVSGLVMGAFVLSAMRLQADEIAPTTAALAVLGSAALMAFAAAILSDGERRRESDGSGRERRLTKVIGVAAAVLLVVGIGSELVIGDDVDVRSGGMPGAEWAVIDGGYHFEQAVELDGVVVAVATGQGLMPRWYRYEANRWDRVSDPFPRSRYETTFPGTIHVWLGLHAGGFLAIDRTSGSMLVSTDGATWKSAGSLPSEGPTDVDMGPDAIGVEYRDRVAVRVADGRWLETDGLDNLVAISVAGTELVAQGTNDTWWVVRDGHATPIDGPEHPAGCGGVAQNPDLANEMSTDFHVALSPCADGQTVIVSSAGETWRPVGVAADRFGPPRAVVRAGDSGEQVGIVEVSDPGVTVNNRMASVDTWSSTTDGSIMVFMSDPGHSTGFFCC